MDVTESPDPDQELSEEAKAARESHDQERQDQELDAARRERSERLGHELSVTEDVRPDGAAAQFARESRGEELRTEDTPSADPPHEAQAQEGQSQLGDGASPDPS